MGADEIRARRADREIEVLDGKKVESNELSSLALAAVGCTNVSEFVLTTATCKTNRGPTNKASSISLRVVAELADADCGIPAETPKKAPSSSNQAHNSGNKSLPSYDLLFASSFPFPGVSCVFWLLSFLANVCLTLAPANSESV